MILTRPLILPDKDISRGALYRIYQDAQKQAWFVHGMYD